MNHRSNRLAKLLPVKTDPPVCDTCKGSGIETFYYSLKNGQQESTTRRCTGCGGSGVMKREKR